MNLKVKFAYCQYFFLSLMFLAVLQILWLACALKRRLTAVQSTAKAGNKNMYL